MAIVDLQLDITVTVTKNGESFAFTRTYDRTVKYDSDGSQAKNNTFPKVYYTDCQRERKRAPADNVFRRKGVKAVQQ